MLAVLFLLLPVAACSGWYFAKKTTENKLSVRKFPDKYFLGLNYLLNEQPDLAVDIFLEIIDINGDFVETQLTLGNLFRKKGEVDKAIRLHQGVVDKSNLSKEHRALAELELAKDYVSAGVLDRAEKLFNKLVDRGEHLELSLNNLIEIYQKGKDWESAIKSARQLQSINKHNQSLNISHYYCELAEKELINGNVSYAKKNLDLALNTNYGCARAYILKGNIDLNNKNYESAFNHYTNIFYKNITYFSESIPSLERCCALLDEKNLMHKFLNKCMEHRPDLSIALALSNHVKDTQGKRKALDFITDYLIKYPSLKGLVYFLELKINFTNKESEESLFVIKNIVDKLLSRMPVYRCFSCGFSARVLQWLCPGCKKWETIKLVYLLDE